MKLYFTRHGESEANRLRIISNRDLPHGLTGTGRLQALELAEKLQARPITRIYASPLLRARQTGEILSTALSVPLEPAEALREPDCGVLEGHSDPQAWAEHKYWLDTWLVGRELDNGPQGGETCIAIRDRFTIFIKELVREYGQSPAEFVLVTHGEVLLLGLPGLVEGLDADHLLERNPEHGAFLTVECKEKRLIFREDQQ
jgi:2,3-bisphosphoglycerate-dependent phosphoglycerate mutase